MSRKTDLEKKYMKYLGGDNPWRTKEKIMFDKITQQCDEKTRDSIFDCFEECQIIYYLLCVLYLLLGFVLGLMINVG